MRFFSENRFLSFALIGSILAHGIFLGVHFAAPDAFKLKQATPGLEVILVNAKHRTKPIKADAVAQANLDGGGNADQGRAKSMMPALNDSRDGDSNQDSRSRIAALEAQQQRMLMQMKQSQMQMPVQTTGDAHIVAQPSEATSQVDAVRAAALEAEIARNIERYNRRPVKKQMTPSTMEAGYAVYYKEMQDKIEKIGTLNFPQRNGEKLYGELTVSIAIFQDGTIYGKDGIQIHRSSRNAALDQAALAIVRAAAPFGQFPASMRSAGGKNDVLEIVTTFHFLHDGSMQTDMHSQEK